jgi:hydrogenase/urease accessory protein HupE
VRYDREDLKKVLAISLLSAPPIALMSFDFMFPNITTPSMNKEMLVMMAVSMLAGIPSGYFNRRSDLAMLSVVIYTAVGYILGVAYYSAPFTVYNIELILPGFYYTLFFRYTVILLFIFVLGGFIGAVFGQLVRDSMRSETTKLEFPPREE